MTELRFLRAFEGDNVNVIPADKETAHAILALPTHEVFTLTLQKGQRTSNQNRAMHKYFGMLAEALNDAGQYLNVFPWREGAEVKWDAHNVKTRLWHPIQGAVFEKGSTARLDTKEVNEIYEVLAKHMAEKCGVSVPFPSRGMDD